MNNINDISNVVKMIDNGIKLMKQKLENNNDSEKLTKNKNDDKGKVEGKVEGEVEGENDKNGFGFNFNGIGTVSSRFMDDVVEDLKNIEEAEKDGRCLYGLTSELIDKTSNSDEVSKYINNNSEQSEHHYRDDNCNGENGNDVYCYNNDNCNDDNCNDVDCCDNYDNYCPLFNKFNCGLSSGLFSLSFGNMPKIIMKIIDTLNDQLNILIKILFYVCMFMLIIVLKYVMFPCNNNNDELKRYESYDRVYIWSL